MGCGTSAAKSGENLIPATTDEKDKATVNGKDDTSPETRAEVTATETPKTETLLKKETGEPSKLESDKQVNQESIRILNAVEKPVSENTPSVSEDWSRADEVAIECPLSIRRTVTHLTDHFKAEKLEGVHLARAVFRWITSHIQWRAGGSQQPDSVLRKGGGEDAGFVALFNTMCAECGIVTQAVDGYVKDAAYIPGSVPDTASHSWSILTVQQVQYVVDCSRGAGIVRDGVFEPRFNDFYWMPSSAEILYTHLPADAAYQGCSKTYSIDEWSMLPKTTHLYFKYRCDMTGELRAVFTAANSLLQIKLTVPVDVVLGGEIVRLEPKQKLPQSYSYTTQDAEQCVLYSGYPYSGKYLLRLLARDRAEEGALKAVAEFSVTVEKGRGTDPLYPVNENHSRCFLLVGPLMGELVRDMPAYFHCKVTGASQVSVLEGEDICPLKKINDNRADLVKIAQTNSAITAPIATADPVSEPAQDGAPAPKAAETLAEAAAPAEAESTEQSGPEADTAPTEPAPEADTVPTEPAPEEAESTSEAVPAESASEPPAVAIPDPAPDSADVPPAEPTPNETAPAENTPDTTPETGPAEGTVPESTTEVPPEAEGTEASPGSTATSTTPVITVPDSAVTTVWAGEVTVRGREVHLAGFFPDTDDMEYTNLVKFHTKII